MPQLREGYEWENLGLSVSAVRIKIDLPMKTHELSNPPFARGLQVPKRETDK